MLDLITPQVQSLIKLSNFCPYCRKDSDLDPFETRQFITTSRAKAAGIEKLSGNDSGQALHIWNKAEY